MSNTLLQDSGVKTPDWDIGNGEDEPEIPIIRANTAKPAEGDAAKPATSVFRHTSTPQPADTHRTDALPEHTPVVAQAKTVDFGKGFPAEFDENFPNDLAKCYAILRSVDNLQTHVVNAHGLVEVPARVKEARRRRKLIGAHILKLSGSHQPIPQMQANEYASIQRAQHERPAILNARADVILEFVKNNPMPELSGTYEPDPENTSENLGLTPKMRLLGNERVQQWLMKARILACSAEAFSILNWDLINPGEYVAALQRELRSCRDPERARELQSKISVSQQSGETTESEFSWRKNKPTGISKGQIEQQWEPAIKALQATFDLCRMLVAEWRMEAIFAETKFFDGFAMEWRQTEVSKRFADLDAELKTIQVTKHSFAWFGINDYAASDSETD